MPWEMPNMVLVADLEVPQLLLMVDMEVPQLLLMVDLELPLSLPMADHWEVWDLYPLEVVSVDLEVLPMEVLWVALDLLHMVVLLEVLEVSLLGAFMVAWDLVVINNLATLLQPITSLAMVFKLMTTMVLPVLVTMRSAMVTEPMGTTMSTHLQAFSQ